MLSSAAQAALAAMVMEEATKAGTAATVSPNFTSAKKEAEARLRDPASWLPLAVRTGSRNLFLLFKGQEVRK